MHIKNGEYKDYNGFCPSGVRGNGKLTELVDGIRKILPENKELVDVCDYAG
jgi:hypothetical protein